MRIIPQIIFNDADAAKRLKGLMLICETVFGLTAICLTTFTDQRDVAYSIVDKVYRFCMIRFIIYQTCSAEHTHVNIHID